MCGVSLRAGDRGTIGIGKRVAAPDRMASSRHYTVALRAGCAEAGFSMKLQMGRNSGRIQPVDATHSLNISAGVWKPSVLRGLSFNCLAIALS